MSSFNKCRCRLARGPDLSISSISSGTWRQGEAGLGLGRPSSTAQNAVIAFMALIQRRYSISRVSITLASTCFPASCHSRLITVARFYITSDSLESVRFAAVASYYAAYGWQCYNSASLPLSAIDAYSSPQAYESYDLVYCIPAETHHRL
ncbi:hypothetical protein BDV11DRAFT_196253 [Aspergillus similis]